MHGYFKNRGGIYDGPTTTIVDHSQGGGGCCQMEQQIENGQTIQTK